MPIQANRIYFSYTSDQPLLSNLELQLSSHARVAVTGPNGSGKTTLLRLLARGLLPSAGHVTAPAHVRWLEQQSTQFTSHLSGGEARLSALRALFSSGASALLLDEPTNDLDADARRWLMQAINQFEGAILMVSHDPQILDLVDEIWKLRQGQIVKHPAGFSAYQDRLTREEELLQSQIDAISAQSKRVEVAARTASENQQKRMERGKKAGAKTNLPKIIRGAKKRQAQNTLARVERVHADRSQQSLSRLTTARERLRQISLFKWNSSVTRPPLGKRLLQVDQAGLLNSSIRISFEMRGPERVQLKGKNGSGKSTLLQALCGDARARARLTGDLYLAQPFQLFDQRLSQFTTTESLWEWFQNKTSLETAFARTILGQLGLKQQDQLRPVRALGGGERVRLELALALNAAQPPQVLLLNEPTNHLDLESRRILLAFVNEFEGGIVVVSHDQTFLDSIKFDEVIDLNAKPIKQPQR